MMPWQQRSQKTDLGVFCEPNNSEEEKRGNDDMQKMVKMGTEPAERDAGELCGCSRKMFFLCLLKTKQ